MRISSPCPVSWDSLTGDRKVRYCGQCRLNVYNLAEMSREEVAGIVRKTQGRLCGRLYVREDGTATVRDCAGGRVRRTAKKAWAVAVVLLLAVFGWMLRAFADSDRSVHPEWVQVVLQWVDPKPTPRKILVMGEACPVPPPTSSPKGSP